MKYFKTVDEAGELTRLDTSGIAVSGEEISETEYKMTRAGIRVFINGENIEDISEDTV